VLTNPPNDARDVGAALITLGFDVKVVVDADLGAMQSAVKALARGAEGADVVLAYYAGPETGERRCCSDIAEALAQSGLVTKAGKPFTATAIKRTVEGQAPAKCSCRQDVPVPEARRATSGRESEHSGTDRSGR
jgi:uncharacterized caspase-like protein